MLAAVAAIGLAFLVAAGSVWIFGRSDLICKGVIVNGLELGGLTREQAAGRIGAWFARRADRSVTLTALDARWTGKLSDFGARLDVEGAVARAFGVGREGSLLSRPVCVLTSGGPGKRFAARLILDDGVVRKTISKVAHMIDRPHRDASIRVVEGRLEIRPDSCGIRLNQGKALAEVKSALQMGLAVVPLPAEVDKPEVTAADAQAIDTLLGRYTTSFNPGKRDRTHNLTLAARAISGKILMPGKQFSYNGIIGPRELSRGFRNAIIFINGKQEEGLGGGICQVSSTLYNAVLLAGLKIVERSHHSRTVPYVVPGRDATVAYGSRDFRFENPNSAPVCVLTAVGRARLTIDIYGAAADKKNISVYSTQSRRVAARTVTVVDGTLRPGQRKLVEPASPGVSATVYRKITQQDGSVVTEVVSRDRYLPQASVVAVGRPAKAPPSAEVVPANNPSDAGESSEVRTD